jgi:hypothetical protein
MYTEYDDQDNYEIASYVYNNHYLLTSSTYYLIISGGRENYGHFVNEIALDRVNDVFFSYRSGLRFSKQRIFRYCDHIYQ